MKPSALAPEIIKLLLDDGWTFTGDCLVLRTSFRKLDKKPYTLISYFALMVLTFSIQHVSTYKAVELSGTEDSLLNFSKVMFWLSMLLWLVVW